MALSEKQVAKIHADIARREGQGDEISKRILGALDSLPAEGVRAILRLYVDEVGYLGDHFPDERENTKRFACSGATWHRCSFGGPHQQGCKAIGGDGNLVGGHDSATSCEADCDASAPEEPWCHCSGFDCVTCDIVDALLGLLAAHGVA